MTSFSAMRQGNYMNISCYNVLFIYYDISTNKSNTCKGLTIDALFSGRYQNVVVIVIRVQMTYET